MAKKAIESGKDPNCPYCKGQRRHSKNGRKQCKAKSNTSNRK